MSLILSDISYRYAPGTPLELRALDDVSLEVEPGSITFVIGSTGSGKSTLLRIMGGLSDPESGTALLDEKPIRAGEVGLVFQQPESQLFAETVVDDIAFGPRNFGKTEDEARVIACEMLEMVGLDVESYATRSPFSLSGGEARRVAIAGVLALSPRYLLLDEPTAGLDGFGRSFVHDLLKRLRLQGVGIVVVSHDIDEFLGYADDVMLLLRGRCVWQGRAKEVIEDPGHFGDAGLAVPPILAIQAIVAERVASLCGVDEANDDVERTEEFTPKERSIILDGVPLRFDAQEVTQHLLAVRDRGEL